MLMHLRSENQAIQRNQFEAEKKVAVADTSIQNLQRSNSPDGGRKRSPRQPVKTTGRRKKIKEEELEAKAD